MTAHMPPERAMPSQQAVDLVVALQRCLTRFHALQEEPPVLDGQDGDGFTMLARYVEARRARSMLFGQGLFADPAWDLLLALFQAELEDRTMTLEQLTETLRLSMNVMLNHVGILERRGLLAEHRLHERGIYALYPSRRFLDAKVRTWVEFLKEQLPLVFRGNRTLVENPTYWA